MSVCLKVVKLALENLSDRNSAEKQTKNKETMKEHLDNCRSCSDFVKDLDVKLET